MNKQRVTLFTLTAEGNTKREALTNAVTCICDSALTEGITQADVMHMVLDGFMQAHMKQTQAVA